MPNLTVPHRNEIPKLRPNPTEEDGDDGSRIQFSERLWESQTWSLQQRDRQIEENVRMLAGQQWHIYSSLLQKWVDVSRLLTDKERRWRQRPVINRLLYWYMLTHARMTENPPVVTFQPSTGSRSDSQLAEVMDTIYKSLWDELDMLEVLDRFFSWLIPGGEAFIQTRVDLNRGPFRDFVGPALVDIGGESVVIPDTPFDEQGNPLVSVDESGLYEFTGAPYRYREGSLVCDVLSPIQVRGEWGPMPWHQKRWILTRSLISPEEVQDLWGVRVEEDAYGHMSSESGELERLLFGGGYYGAAENEPGSEGYTATQSEGLITVSTLWMKPTRAIPGLEETEESPGGRLLVTAPNVVLFDSVRPAKFRSAGPIQCLKFVDLPGRPAGTTPQEMLNPIQRSYNRGWAQMLEHRNLVTNPALVIDDQAGLTEDQVHNKPGLTVVVTRRSGVPAMEYVSPPRLSDDVYKTQSQLAEEINLLGNLSGAEGEPPTRDASGELVKELRFNSDRFIGPTMRRGVNTMRRVVQDWMDYLPLIWDEEKIVAYAGDDSVTRTITVLPEMFEEGSVNIRVDLESMLPEGRGERQARIFRMYADGLFGMMGSETAIRKFFELSRFPHMGRTARPGGIHQVTAEQENGRITLGETADTVPVLDWYDDAVHLVVHEDFMSSPEFLKLDPQIMDEFAKHREVHRRTLLMKMAQATAQAVGVQGGQPEQEQSKDGEGAGASSANGATPQDQGTELASGGQTEKFPGF